MNSSKRKITALFGMAVALVLPLSFYIIAKAMGKDKLDMPVYYKAGDQKVAARDAGKEVQNGALKPVAELSAFNQFGDLISLNRDLPGKMLAIDFFFTTCTGACPKLTANMYLLEHAFRRTPMKRNDTMVQFISISVDPANDSAVALRAYAKRAGVDENHWWFITGDKKKLYAWARTQLHLAVPPGDGGADDFIHSNEIILVDAGRYIRGYYDGLDTASIIRCANDMGLLAMEKRKF